MTVQAFPIRAMPALGMARAGELALRPATSSDLPFLRLLYGMSRRDEVAAAGWPPSVVERFLNSQFALQHDYYVQQFGGADFLIVEDHGAPVGRFYIEPRGGDLHIVDISLIVSKQDHGLGTCLIEALKHHASTCGQGVTLQVSRVNPRAQALYTRLGFQITGVTDTHVAMRWFS